MDIPEDKINYLLFPPKIMADITQPCTCSNKCEDKLRTMKGAISKIQNIRLNYHSIKQGPLRTTKLMEMIRHSRIISTENSNKHLHNFEEFIFCVCKWTQILGISLATYYRAVSYVNEGYINMDVNITRKQSSRNLRGLSACGFIEVMLQKYSDYSPLAKKRILPPGISKKFLWEEYSLHGDNHVGEHYFYKLFQKNFEIDVSFAKHKYINPCTICLLASRKLHTLRDPNQKAVIKEELQEHLNRQRTERLDYYRKREQAIATPTNYMSIIVDGMDQSKTGVPHFRGWARPKDAQQYIKTHITGLISHGRKDMFFVDCNEYPHDPNLTATCLINAMQDQLTENHCLPATLFIQCDNCGRENKNKYLLGFLAYLCLAGYFKDVYFSFLMKGHTHEDIDQRFSCISQHLRRVDAFTLPNLCTEVKNSFTSPCHVEKIGTVWNVREWMSPCINNITNHSFAHQFWLTADTPGHVTLKAKLWSSDEWYPSAEEEPLELFLYDRYEKQCIPQGDPLVVKPDFEKINLREFKQAIDKMKLHLSYEQYQWWLELINKPENYGIKKTRWPLKDIRPVHKVISLPPNVVNKSTTVLDPLMNEERRRPKVKAKKRKLVC